MKYANIYQNVATIFRDDFFWLRWIFVFIVNCIFTVFAIH